MSDNQKWEIIHGDALKVLSGFVPGTFDAVITDPSYASGGRTQSEKSKSIVKKYSSMKENAPILWRRHQGSALLDPLGSRVAVRSEKGQQVRCAGVYVH